MQTVRGVLIYQVELIQQGKISLPSEFSKRNICLLCGNIKMNPPIKNRPVISKRTTAAREKQSKK
jgi:hypothetical protein